MCWEEGNTGEGAKETGIGIVVVSRCSTHLKPLASLDGKSAQKGGETCTLFGGLEMWPPQLHSTVSMVTQPTAAAAKVEGTWKGLRREESQPYFSSQEQGEKMRQKERKREWRELGEKESKSQTEKWIWMKKWKEGKRRENVREREGKAHEYWHCPFFSESDLPYHNPQEEHINILKEWRCFYGKPRNFSP